VHHNIQPAPVTHSDDGLDRTMLTRSVQDLVQEWDERSDTFEGKPFRTREAGLQHLFEQFGSNEKIKNVVSIQWFWGSFHPSLNPLTTLRIGNMHEFNAYRTTIIEASKFGTLPLNIQLRMGLRLEETKGINIRMEVTPPTEGFKDLFVHIIPMYHVPVISCREYLCDHTLAP
jgi:hypothetical protein